MFNKKIIILFCLIGLLLFLFLLPPTVTTFAPPSPTQQVEQAWQLAQAVGIYQYDAFVEQTVYPSPAIVNAGREPRKQQLALAGDVNLLTDELNLTLWPDGSFDSARGLAVKVVEGEAFGRASAYDEWQRMDNVAEMFAPGGDPLGFLAAVTHIQQGESRNYAFADTLTLDYAQYTFELDGPSFAAYQREQIEKYLQIHGKSPYGVSMNSNPFYQQMHGSGELWLDVDGLPTRMIINLAMPLANDERLEATITNNYTQFDRQRLEAKTTSFFATPKKWFQRNQTDIVTTSSHVTKISLFAILTLIFLLWLIVQYWQTRPFYIAIITAVILSMLFTPFFQTHSANAFHQEQQRQTERHAEQTQNQEKTEAIQDVLHTAWNPQQNPLANKPLLMGEGRSLPANLPANFPLTALTTITDTTDSDNDGLIDIDEFYWGSCPYPVATTEYDNYEYCAGVADPTDTDADTLTDYVEVYQTATDPTSDDTDNDGILDQVEIDGFNYNGKLWYLNPLEQDSNGDNIIDGEECPIRIYYMSDYDPTAACPDLDNDGIPDIFDDDNDNDNILDKADFTPSTTTGVTETFSANSSLKLDANNLETNKPVRLTLQFRPNDAENLYLSGHVLDWPTGDTEGQIQRRLDTTFANTSNLAIQSDDPRAANGDIRLIPALELYIPYETGHYGNLPVKPIYSGTVRSLSTPVADWIDQEALDLYSINVRDVDESSGGLVAYLPVNAVTSADGEETVAFQADMFYQPNQGTVADPSLADWGAKHQYSLVWIVQMITEECVNPEIKNLDICLTLPGGTDNLRETIQIIHVYYDDWYLTGLEMREEHGHDITILYENPADDTNLAFEDELWPFSWNLSIDFLNTLDCETYDEVTNSCLGDGERDVSVATIDAYLNDWSGGQTIIDTAAFSYPHSDLVINVMLTETNTLLDTHFTPYAHEVYPTFLFMQENSARSLMIDNEMSFFYNQLSLDFADVPKINMGSLNWNTYQYNDNLDSWENVDIENYLIYLNDIVTQDSFFVPLDNTLGSQNEAIGKQLWAQNYYLAVRQGHSSIQTYNDQPISQDITSQPSLATLNFAITSLSPLAEMAKKFAELTKKAVKYSNNSLSNFWAVFKAEFQQLKGNNTFSRFKLWGKQRVISPFGTVTLSLLVIGALLIATGLILYLTANDKASAQTALTIIAIGAIMVELINTFKSIAKAANIIRQAKTLAILYSVSSKITRFRQMFSSIRKAEAISFIFTIVLEAAIFITLWLISGENFNAIVIQSLLALSIANLIIELLLLLFILAVPIIGLIIVTILGLIEAILLLFNIKGPQTLFAEWIASWLYDVDSIIINLDDEDRLDISLVDLGLTDPYSTGFTVYNGIRPTFAITNHIQFDKDENSYDQARRATFRYFLQSAPIDQHDDLDLNQMKNEWLKKDGGLYVTVNKSLGALISFADVGSGINRSLANRIYLTEAFAAPLVGCWLDIDSNDTCDWYTEPGSIHINIGKSMIYDILPATLNGFMHFNWDHRLPKPIDRDGDGLISTEFGGADPSDYSADFDNDNLSDLYELSNGLNPLAADNDNDGLLDRDELYYHTDPNDPDTDDDGLSDYIEVAEGWLVAYNDGANQMRVWSDPLIPDADGDTLSDLEEYLFATHPFIATDPSILENIFNIDNMELNEPTNAVAYLPFEENEGAEVFIDYTENGHRASCDRLTTSCPLAESNGRYGNGLIFDGNNDQATMANSTDINLGDHQNLAIAVWFKVDNATINTHKQLIYEQGGGTKGISLYVYDGQFYAHIQGTDTLSWQVSQSEPIQSNRWYHAGFILEGGNPVAGALKPNAVSVYLDGVLIGQGDGRPLAEHSNGIGIGRVRGGTRFHDGVSTDPNPFGGQIDELLLFDQPLTSAELNAVMKGHLNLNDLIVIPDTTLTYQATITNNATITASGFLNANSTTIHPEIASPIVAFSFETDEHFAYFNNTIYHTEENPLYCTNNGTCPASISGVTTANEPRLALDFDGVDDYLVLPTLIYDSVDVWPLEGTFRFMLWVDALPPSNERAYILDSEGTSNNDIDLWLNSNGNLVLGIAGSGFYTSSYTFNAGNRNKWVAIELYDFKTTIDGNDEPFGSNLYQAQLGPGHLGNSIDGNSPFNGRLDDLIISVPWEGDIAIYRFSELVNYDYETFYDDNGTSNDASCTGNKCPIYSTTAEGESGRALIFDGVNDLLNQTGRLDYDIPNSDEISIYFDIYPLSYPAFGQKAYIYDSQYTAPSGSDDASFDLYLDENGQFNLQYNDTTTTIYSNSTIPLNQWSTIRVRFKEYNASGNDSVRVELYVNGIEDGLYAGICSSSSCLTRLTVDNGTIGNNIAETAPFHGRLDTMKLLIATHNFDPLSTNIGYHNRANHIAPAICDDIFTCPTISTGTGQHGAALLFDGQDDTLIAPGLDLAYNSFAIAAWAKRESVGTADHIISQGTTSNNQGLLFGFYPSNKFTCNFWGNGVTTPLAYTDNDWHHWACTYDTQTNLRTIYRDGVAIISDTASSDYIGQGDLLIGNRFQSSTHHFDGQIDELFMTTQAVSAQAVALLMATTYPIIDLPIPFLPFDASPQTRQTLTGTIHIDPYATSSQYQFSQEIEAALNLQSTNLYYATYEAYTDTIDLYLPFDETPGSTQFENWSIYGQTTKWDIDANCIVPACPRAGQRAIFDRGVFFDGIDDAVHLDFAPIPGISSPKMQTIAFWVNATNGTLFSFDESGTSNFYELDMHELREEDGAIVTPLSIPTNEWVHVAVTFDDGTLSADDTRIYLNGTEVATGTQHIFANTEPDGLVIGANRFHQDFLEGYIDEFYIYDYYLSAAEIQALYKASTPLVAFNFDEDETAVLFQDSSPNQIIGTPRPITITDSLLGTITTISPPPGVDGKIGNTALFSGTGYIEINDPLLNTLGNDITIMMWVNPDDATINQRLFGAGRLNSADNGLSFSIRDENLRLNAYGSSTYGNNNAPIISGIWQHVAVVLDSSNDAYFYIDGILQDINAASNPPIFNTDDPWYIGSSIDSSGNIIRGFSGEIDEFAIYQRALPAQDIARLYQRQLRWFSDKATFQITVDTDTPTINLLTTNPYRANQYQQLVVTANDPTSQIIFVDFGLKAPSDNTYDWQNAPICTDLYGASAAWCPSFDPSQLGGEGVYTVQFRAVDSVGNETISTPHTFYIDNTPPTAATIYNQQWRNLTEISPLTWSLNLTGTLSDPPITSTVMGSGVYSPSAKIILEDSSGHPLGNQPQPVTIINNNWSANYTFTQELRPHGQYTLTIFLADHVGNNTTLNIGTFLFDERPPHASLDYWAVPDHMITNALTLMGTTNEQARWGGQIATYHFNEANGATTFYDSTPNNNQISCAGIICPTADQTGYTGQAILFDGTDDYLQLPITNSQAISNRLSISLWLYPTNFVNPAQTILAQQDGSVGIGQNWLTIAPDGQLKTDFISNYPISTTLTLNQWTHIGLTYDGTQTTLYIDGLLKATDTFTTPLSAGNLLLGIDKDINLGHLHGRLDELTLYRRHLPANEMRALAQRHNAGIAQTDITVTPFDFANGAGGSENWQPANITNDRWDYTLPNNLEDFYQISVKTTDAFGNVSPDNVLWRGTIDMVTPTLTLTAQHLGWGSASQTVISYSATDLRLDLDSLISPCSLASNQLTPHPYLGHTIQLDTECGLVGHQSGPFTVTVCDSNNRCASQTVAPSPATPLDSITILTPTTASQQTINTPLTLSGGAYDTDNIQHIQLFANGSLIDIITPTVTTMDTMWTTVWTPTIANSYNIDAVLVDALGNQITDTLTITAVDLNNCYVALNNNYVTQYSSNDASALRLAVAAAFKGDIIRVSGTCTGVQNENGTNQLLYLRDDLTIVGGYLHANWLLNSNPDNYPTILDADANGRVLYITDTANITLTKLTLQNGQQSNGGNIHNRGHLTLVHTIVRDGTAPGVGGGIYNLGETHIAQSLLTGHFSGGSGSAIYNLGDLNISNSTLTANNTNWNGAALLNDSGTATITHATIVSNSTDMEQNGDGVAAIFSFNGGTITLEATIVAGNLHTGTLSDPNADCSGNVSDLGYNIVGDNTGCSTSSGTTQTISPTQLNTVIAPFAYNHYPLQATSPALDAIPIGNCPLNVDQRQISRPQNNSCDIGAHEYWDFNINIASPTTAGLSWVDANLNCTYNLFASTTPYFTPIIPTYLNASTPYQANNRLGDTNTNYYFMNRATCANGTNAYSNIVGEFDVTIISGQ